MGDCDVNITTLSDNAAGDGFLAEWGLSLLIEAGDKRILFDTGAGDVAVRNAEALGVPLTSLDAIVLSHGHADHTGGLKAVLGKSGRTRVIAHPGIWKPRYSLRAGDKNYSSIGMPYAREELEAGGAQFVLSRSSVGIASGIVTSGEIPLVTSYEKVDSNLLVESEGLFMQDELEDDLSLLIVTRRGLVVVLGCAHRGVINILLHARSLTGIPRVAAIIGGMHLMAAGEERINNTIAGLKEAGVEKLIISHCTGERSSKRLKQEFGEACLFNSAGARFTLP